MFDLTQQDGLHRGDTLHFPASDLRSLGIGETTRPFYERVDYGILEESPGSIGSGAYYCCANGGAFA